jgi:drug/metabolite transporter (DMT)-like permease
MKSDTFKGYFFAFIATVAFSNVYIFSKAALNEVHLAQFGIYWFAIGTILNFLMAAKNKKLVQAKTLTRKQIRILVTLGILEILTTSTFFISINIISDPAVTSFLGNMYPVFLTLGGIFLLKEKFGWIEIIGAILALTGAFVISYTGGTTLKTIFIAGTGIVFVNALLAATASLVVKVHVKKLSPEFINLNRTVWLFAFSIVVFLATNQSLEIPVSALKNIAVGAILGPFLAVLTVYYSFNYIAASRSSVVQSLKGIFVLLGSYLFFKTIPLPHQLAGGFITILGVLFMTLAQTGIFQKKA